MHQDFIRDCLKPIYELQWLKQIQFEPELINNLLLYLAYSDNRLLHEL